MTYQFIMYFLEMLRSLNLQVFNKNVICIFKMIHCFNCSKRCDFIVKFYIATPNKKKRFGPATHVCFTKRQEKLHCCLTSTQSTR